MTAFKPGDLLMARTAFGNEVLMRALSGIESGKGHSFPIVWVRRESGYAEGERIPWPVEALRHEEVTP